MECTAWVEWIHSKYVHSHDFAMWCLAGCWALNAFDVEGMASGRCIFFHLDGPSLRLWGVVSLGQRAWPLKDGMEKCNGCMAEGNKGSSMGKQDSWMFCEWCSSDFLLNPWPLNKRKIFLPYNCEYNMRGQLVIIGCFGGSGHTIL